MGFVKKLAQGGMFGMAGVALSKDKKKDKPKPSLTTGDFNSSAPSSSLVNQKSIY